ncbi:MAG TPA: hypothetical protein VLH08_08790 [Acidobacteriota bacterium]|nr:hypothetical protein [Acidobacteriota bacterium]
MTGVLITFNIASLLTLVYVFWQGYSAGVSVPMKNHILMALLATGLAVFSHAMTMMYFAALGRMIRQAVEKGNLNPEAVQQTKKYRSLIFRVGSIAMLVVMAQTILGGGAHTRVFPVWVHEAQAVFTLVVSFIAVFIEIRYLILNHLLGHQVAQQYGQKIEDGG